MNTLSNFFYHFSRHLTLLFVIVALSACVSTKHLEDQAVLKLNNNLEQLQNWKLTGKIAWITPQERKSAYVNWRQNQNNMRFDLTNLLGINMASLSYDGLVAILKADGKEYIDPSPDALIWRTTGWTVPLLPLRHWIKGATDENASIEPLIERYDNGLLKKLSSSCENCDQWIIDYTSYENVVIDNNQYQLPKQISMFNPKNKATIKIRVSQWSL